MKRILMLLPLLLVTLPVCGQTTKQPCKCQWAELDPADKKMKGPKCYEGPERLAGGIVSGKIPPVRGEIKVASLKTTMPLFKLCINENGEVEKVFVLRPSGIEDIDRRMCEGFYVLRFQPPTVDGKPVRSSTYITRHIYI